jgi:hypothetical protein
MAAPYRLLRRGDFARRADLLLRFQQTVHLGPRNLCPRLQVFQPLLLAVAIDVVPRALFEAQIVHRRINAAVSGLPTAKILQKERSVCAKVRVDCASCP